MGKGEEGGGKMRKDKEWKGKREGASKGKGKMERIERISNKHEQEETKEKGERERATKSQGKEKENHFFSLLLFTSFPLPCTRAIPLFNLFVLLRLAGGSCLHKGPRCHFWISGGIGWSIGWKGVTFSSPRSTKIKARWCNPMPHVNIHQEMWSDASPIWELLPLSNWRQSSLPAPLQSVHGTATVVSQW